MLSSSLSLKETLVEDSKRERILFSAQSLD